MGDLDMFGRYTDLFIAVLQKQTWFGISEMADSLKTPKTTIHRQLRVLVKKGIVIRDEDTRKYHVSTKTLNWLMALGLLIANKSRSERAS